MCHITDPFYTFLLLTSNVICDALKLTSAGIDFFARCLSSNPALSPFGEGERGDRAQSVGAPVLCDRQHVNNVSLKLSRVT